MDCLLGLLLLNEADQALATADLLFMHPSALACFNHVTPHACTAVYPPLSCFVFLFVLL